MQRSTASPSTIMQSADNDCVASQNNDTNKTAAKTHTQSCGRFGCPAIFVYAVGTDWPTVSRLINDHSLVCMGGFYRLSHLPPRANPHDIPHTPSPPPPAPESLGVETSNREDEVSAGGCKRRRKEDKRKEELEDDEYTEDVQPTSVRCRGCQKAISLDKRSRYYPGLWVKHRGKCPGIRKIERDKKTSQENKPDFPSNPERRPPAGSSFEASGEDWEEESDEDEAIGFSTSNVRFVHDC